MQNASLYRVGGTALIAGAVVQAVAIFLHAPQPMDVAAYATTSQGQWFVSHWMLVIGTTLITGGLLALARHLFSTKGEGWAVLGFGALIASSALWVAIVAPEIAAFPLLAQSTDPGAPHAFLAVNLNLMSLVHVASPVFWLGVGGLAFAMISDSTFSKTLAQVGVVLALVEVVVGFTPLGENWTVFRILFAVGLGWIAVAGNALRNVKAGVPAY